ncbi:MAG: hypothetical protein NZ578_08170 [Candidatus Binatia bacterium]|nr:hypothetical protein [Candidatus Binatia bacterium]
MRRIIGSLIPSAMIPLGASVLLITSPGEQVILPSDHALPKDLALVCGLLGLGGSPIVMLSALTHTRRRVQ